MPRIKMNFFPKASLINWVRPDRRGELGSVGEKPGVAIVTPEMMEFARLRAENARMRMERDIANKLCTSRLHMNNAGTRHSVIRPCNR